MSENKFNSTVEALLNGMDSVVSSKTVVGEGHVFRVGFAVERTVALFLVAIASCLYSVSDYIYIQYV